MREELPPAKKVITTYLMSSLFSEFFRGFSTVILGCETTWGLFGDHFEGVWGEIRWENDSKNKKNKNFMLFLFEIALNGLFNEQDVFLGGLFNEGLGL